MTGKANLRYALAAAAVFAVGTLFGGAVVRQHPRDIPSYPEASQSFGGTMARIAVCPLPIAGEMLSTALMNGGCRVVLSTPQCGCGMGERPDCILEPISLVSKTERNGASVSLVTVLIVRVRKPVAFGETARGRTFQGASRIMLGNRRTNAKGETDASQQEIAEGVRLAVGNLLRIPDLKTAIAEAG